MSNFTILSEFNNIHEAVGLLKAKCPTLQLRLNTQVCTIEQTNVTLYTALVDLVNCFKVGVHHLNQFLKIETMVVTPNFNFLFKIMAILEFKHTSPICDGHSFLVNNEILIVNFSLFEKHFYSILQRPYVLHVKKLVLFGFESSVDVFGKKIVINLNDELLYISKTQPQPQNTTANKCDVLNFRNVALLVSDFVYKCAILIHDPCFKFNNIIRGLSRNKKITCFYNFSANNEFQTSSNSNVDDSDSLIDILDKCSKCLFIVDDAQFVENFLLLTSLPVDVIFSFNSGYSKYYFDTSVECIEVETTTTTTT